MERCTLRCTNGLNSLLKSEQLLEPGSMNEFPQTQMNEIEDYDHQEDGFITDLEANRNLCPVIWLRTFRTTNREESHLVFRDRRFYNLLVIAATTTLYQETW
jgi:hypothetical protein